MAFFELDVVPPDLRTKCYRGSCLKSNLARQQILGCLPLHITCFLLCRLLTKQGRKLVSINKLCQKSQ